VEPAKDDILFSNEYLVLEAIENLFRDIYGESKPVSAVKPPHPLIRQLDNFELLLARKPTQSSTNPTESSPSEAIVPRQSPNKLHASVPSLPSPIASDPVMGTDTLAQSIEGTENETVRDRRKWGFDMSKDFTEDTGGLGRTNLPNKFRSPGPAQKSTSENTTSSSPLNPWLIAKMTAPVRQDSHKALPAPSHSHNLAPEPSSSPLQMPRQSSEPLFLEFDDPQMPNASAQPRRPYSNKIIRNPAHSMTNNPPSQYYNQPRRRYSNEDLRRGRSSLADGYDEVFVVEEQALQLRRRNDFVSARNLPENAFVSPPATERPRGAKRSNGVNKPFALPRTTTKNATHSDGFRQATLFDGYQAQNGNREERRQMEANPELEWAMDYEQRKEGATRRHRQEHRRIRADSFQRVSDEIVRSSPHKNRYMSAVKALEADQLSSRNNARVVEPFKTTLSDGDPRAYLMKQQRLMAVPNVGPLKLSRTKSMKLPLERIPDNHQTHKLLLTLTTGSDRLRKLMTDAAKDDMYVNHGSYPAGFAIDAPSMSALTRNIQAVVEKWMDTEKERKCEVEYNFENLLSGESFGVA
jgi:hypothetical protein